MHPPAGLQWMMMLLAVVILYTVHHQEASAGHSPVRVTRSAVESLRDRGTYIIHFKDHVTEEELQQFAAALSRSPDKNEIVTAEIIEDLFIIKCLTARLSRRALSWVRIVEISKLSTHFDVNFMFSIIVMNLLPCDHCLIFHLGHTP